ncbi:MAG: hypothetical protein J5884_04590 [Paludibacteraceae bacterium]|nr:hypothetical protein [Paludibacteraceae bacterium]
MKTYNRPYTQITSFKTLYMLMSGNVSGGGFNGVKETTGDTTIEIY